MPFLLDADPSSEELSDAVNYLLANTTAGVSSDKYFVFNNPNTGFVANSAGTILQYQYRYLDIKYADTPAGLNFSYLDTEISKMYRFIKGHPKRPEGLTPEKQSSILLVILESLHKDEAELLIKLMKKDLGVKFLTPKLVKEAYPNLNI